MKKYYLFNGTEKEGPFDLETLKAQNLTNDTPIWYEGLADWTIAEKVYELRSLFPIQSDPNLGLYQTPPPFHATEEIVKKKLSPGRIVITVLVVLVVILVGFIILDLLDRPTLF
jgi:hypothetical protein